MKTIGENLSELRKKAGYTQEQIAEKVGISPQAVSKWENDLTSPDAAMLVTLSNLYGVTVDALLKGNQPYTEEADKSITDKRILHILTVTDEDRINVRIPIAVIDAFEESGALAKMIPDISVLDTIRKMAVNGVIGEVITSDTANTKVQISIEKYGEEHKDA